MDVLVLVVMVASIIVIILARGIAKGVVRELVQHIATVVVIILAQGVVIMGVKMFLGNLLSCYHFYINL